MSRNPIMRDFIHAAAAIAVPLEEGAQQVIQSEKHAFRVVTLVKGLSFPWRLRFSPTTACW